MEILGSDEVSLERAALFLKQSEIVAFPTETVFGLGVSLFCDQAIEKLYQIKKRSHGKPFSAHISDLTQVSSIAMDIPPLFYLLAKKFWPGPLTIVLKKNPSISSLATAGFDTIGIRFPHHPVALQLLKKCPFPVAATSANISGSPCLQTSSELIQTFGSIAAFIDAKEQPQGTPSTVISLAETIEPILLREGSLSFDIILDSLK